MKTISEVHQAGGKITSFLSYCGGLPAPEASDNPLGTLSLIALGKLLAKPHRQAISSPGPAAASSSPSATPPNTIKTAESLTSLALSSWARPSTMILHTPDLHLLHTPTETLRLTESAIPSLRHQLSLEAR